MASAAPIQRRDGIGLACDDRTREHGQLHASEKDQRADPGVQSPDRAIENPSR